MKYRLSLLIVLVLVLIAGCGGGGGSNPDPNIVAYCEDGFVEYNQDCSKVCSGHGIILQFGIAGRDCANNPPPLTELPEAVFTPTSKNSPFAGDWHGHVNGNDLSFTIGKNGLITGTSTQGETRNLKGSIADDGGIAIAWWQKPDQHRLQSSLKKQGTILTGRCTHIREFLLNGKVSYEVKNTDAPFDVSPGR